MIPSTPAPKKETPYRLKQFLGKVANEGTRWGFYNIYHWKGSYFESIPHRTEKDSLWGADLRYYKPYGREKPANVAQNDVEWVGILNNNTGVFVGAENYVTRAYQGK